MARKSWLWLAQKTRYSSSTKSLAIEGALWTAAGFGASQLLRFASNLILTRLLFPELFGLMAVVNTVSTGLALFSDVGLGASVIRHKRGEDAAFLNTTWTLQVIRGASLSLICIGIAFPLAEFYGDPRITWLLPLVGLNALLAGFNSTALITLHRRLALRELTGFELAGQVVAVCVTLGWAFIEPSIWALIAGGFASSVFQLVWSHRVLPGQRNYFAWERETLIELVSFGKWIFIGTAMFFLAGQADKLLIGKLFTLELLGAYVIAITLADMPRIFISTISSKVFLPSFSRFTDLPREEFRKKIQRGRGTILAVMAVGLAFVVSFGDCAITILYDARYGEAAWMMPLLAMRTWPMALTDTITPALISIGKPSVTAIGHTVSFVALILGMLVGATYLGPLGAVLGVTISRVPFYISITHTLRREGIACLAQDLRATLLFSACLAAFITGRLALGLTLPL